jgi:hypothetical protein
VTVDAITRYVILLFGGILSASACAGAQTGAPAPLPDAPDEQVSFISERPLSLPSDLGGSIPRFDLPAESGEPPALHLNLAGAQDRSTAPPPDAPDEQPTFMKLLAEHGHHNMENERWNAY